MESPILTIDVGGKTFRVLRETVMRYPHSTLAQVISGKDAHNLIKVDNSYFFDRNPHYFEVVLDLMRYGKLIKPDKLSDEILQYELKFWKILAEDVVSKKPEVSREEVQPTLIMPNEEYEPTLVMAEEVGGTQEYASTLVMDEIEPTLLMPDLPATQELEEKPVVKKFVSMDQDDLLGSLMNSQPEASREERKLPWAGKTSSQKKAVGKPTKRRKIGKDSEEEVGSQTESYESSFIDDREEEEIKPKKTTRANMKTAASMCKKSNLPNPAALSSHLSSKISNQSNTRNR